MLNNLALKEDALVNIQNIFVMYAISVELPVSKNIFADVKNIRSPPLHP